MGARRGIGLGAVALAIGLAGARPAVASTEWQVEEVYSNEDGSVQFIELYSAAGLQNDVMNGQVQAVWTGGSNVFSFGTNIVGDTTDRYLLLATSGFAELCGGVTSNYTLLPDTPRDFFFKPDASGMISIDFVGNDALTFDLSLLPRDGHDSLTDTDLGGVPELIVGPSSPRNFNGDQGVLFGCQPGDACDAGVGCPIVIDAGVSDATAAGPDAGLDGGGDGCGCRSGDGAGGALPWALLVGSALTRRRRRRTTSVADGGRPPDLAPDQLAGAQHPGGAPPRAG
ncbi:MAG TPA: MYXO-CTERM sorting domain-containing protein [Kofleriaceae bacterium]|nr:MYXO-CTERM sorting domain-containing protein [Kofleriaceae bacterium]